MSCTGSCTPGTPGPAATTRGNWPRRGNTLGSCGSNTSTQAPDRGGTSSRTRADRCSTAHGSDAVSGDVGRDRSLCRAPVGDLFRNPGANPRAHLILATATITNDFLPIHDSSLTFRLLVTSGPSRHDQA